MRDLLAVSLLFALVIATSAGCQSSRVASSPTAPPSLAKVNEVLREQPSFLYLTGGRTVRGYDVEVEPDSTYWIDRSPHPEARKSIATGEVQRIAVHKEQSHWVGRILGGTAGTALSIARSTFLLDFPVGTAFKIFTGIMVGELISRRLSRNERVVYQAPITAYAP